MAKFIAKNLTHRTVECHLPGGRWLRLPPRASSPVIETDCASPSFKKLQRRAMIEVVEAKALEEAKTDEQPEKKTKKTKKTRPRGRGAVAGGQVRKQPEKKAKTTRPARKRAENKARAPKPADK